MCVSASERESGKERKSNTMLFEVKPAWRTAGWWESSSMAGRQLKPGVMGKGSLTKRQKEEKGKPCFSEDFSRAADTQLWPYLYSSVEVGVLWRRSSLSH